MANRRFIDFPIASSVGDNDIVLIWQDGLNKQTTKGTLIQGVPTSLEDLTDVDIAGLINGQILQYNSVTGKWENVDRTDIDLDELGDVTIVSPSNGQVLIYNSSTSKWENSSIIGGFVPYTGATQNVDLGEFGLDTGFVNLDTTPTNTPTTQGTMYWDDSRSTAALIMNGTLQHIGQDTFFYVKNSTGSSIAKGTAVRFDGTDGASGHLLIAPFLANGTYPSNYFMGVTAETIANGAFGQVMHFGELEGINTSAYTAGSLLYASTTVAGGFQTTAPVAPNNIVLIAAAINSKNNGEILVRPTYGSNINTDEGVKITTPTTGDLLQLQAGGLWENKTKAQILGGTSSQFVKGDGSLDSTAYGTGSVTSVAALTLGTTGTDLTSTVANGTTTPVITLNVPTASAANRGALSAADWTTFNNKENAITAGTTAQYFRGDKTFQTLNTAAVPELTNLYYTDGRARGALSFVAGSGAYNSTTGVITIPTNNNQITNGAGYITSAALGDYLPLTGGTLTGALGGTSATFKGIGIFNVPSGGNSESGIRIVAPISTSHYNWMIAAQQNVDASFEITPSTVVGGTTFSTPSLKIAGSTGAATFSSSVSVGADLTLSAANPFVYGGTAAGSLGLSNIGGQSYIRVFGASHSTTPNVTQFVNAGATSLTIASTGAATFSSSVSTPHTTKTADYTLTATDYTVGFDCASNRTATLPDATTCQGRIYVIYQYNTGAGTRSVTLDGNGSQTINGVATYSLAPYCDFTSVVIQSNGSNWIIISSNLTVDCL